MLDSTKDSIVEVALLSLVEIATKGTDDDIQAITISRADLKFIDLLDSDNDVCVKSSLQVLTAAKDHIKVYNYTYLLPHVIRIMNVKEPHHLDKLSNCSVLLRGILEADSPPIQRVIELDLIPILIEILTTTEDDTVQLNLEHVIINLFAGTTKQVHNTLMKKPLDTLVEYEGLLPLLVSLVESEDNTISENAISIIDKMAGMNDQYQNLLLLETDAVITLLQVLQAPNSTLSKLEVTTSALVSCCRGGKLDDDFATSKEALTVLTKLLVNDHETIIYNSCWAVFHILAGLKYYNRTEECEEISKVMNIGFVKALLKLIPNAPHHVQEPVLKSLRLISSKGETCIKAISLRNGISRLSKTLSSSHEKNQELATWTISNIISGNRDRIQTAIDNNAVPYLVKMLTLEQNKKHALWTLYQMTKAGSASQIKSLITEGCLDQFCALLTSDCNTVSIALIALKNVSLIESL